MTRMRKTTKILWRVNVGVNPMIIPSVTAPAICLGVASAFKIRKILPIIFNQIIMESPLREKTDRVNPITTVLSERGAPRVDVSFTPWSFPSFEGNTLIMVKSYKKCLLNTTHPTRCISTSSPKKMKQHMFIMSSITRTRHALYNPNDRLIWVC